MNCSAMELNLWCRRRMIPSGRTNGTLSSGTATLLSGTVQSLAAVTLANPVTLNNSTVTLSGLTNLTLAGPLTVNNGAGYTNTLAA